MEPLLQVANSYQAVFSIAHFVEVRSGSEVEVRSLLKAKTALAEFAFTLSWVERNLHCLLFYSET
jgi:hypothetical protein